MGFALEGLIKSLTTFSMFAESKGGVGLCSEAEENGMR